MLIEVPYGKEKIMVNIEETYVAGIIEGNDVLITDEAETVRQAIKNPINSKNFHDFLADAKDVLFIVNDATRPTPTARVLEIIHQMINPLNIKFIVATGEVAKPNFLQLSKLACARIGSLKKCRFYRLSIGTLQRYFLHESVFRTQNRYLRQEIRLGRDIVRLTDKDVRTFLLRFDSLWFHRLSSS